MKKNNRLLLILSLVTLLGACKKSILDEKPPNIIAAETLYTNYNGFEAGLNGLYSLVRQEWEGLAGTTSVAADMSMNGTDNMVTNHFVSGINTIYQDWGALNNPSNVFFSDAFAWLYNIINAANSIIIQAEKPTIDWLGGSASAADNKNRIVAEAKAVRAWAYRHLSYNWGAVPLNLQEAKGTTIRTDWERAPLAVVRRQIITDLLEAEAFVLSGASQPGRLTKGAVQHYLAEMYLAINKPDSALIWADRVVNNPLYKLVTARYGVNAARPGVPFMDMFAQGNINREEGNTEALWVFQFQLQTIGGGQSLQRRHHTSRYASTRVGTITPLRVTTERGGNGLGRMSMTKWAIDNYESADDRASNHSIRKYFILTNAAGNAPAAADLLPPGMNYGDTIWMNWAADISATARSKVNWPFSRKADWADPLNLADFNSYKDLLYLRLADTYLLKAEAEFKLNQPGAAAITLNAIRTRSNATAIDQSAVTLDFILDERSRELFLEEHRRYTLLRTNKWLERTKLYNKNGGQLIVARDTLFPLPQTVIDANLGRPMPQNPGY